MKLYDLLGGSHFTIHGCQQLLVSVSRLMDHNHLDIYGDCKDDIASEGKDTVSHTITNSIGLTVVGKWKIYKRSLDTDLMRLTQ